MKKLLSLLLAGLLGLSPVIAAAQQKLSGLPASPYNPLTDTFIGVRSGATDYQLSAGNIFLQSANNLSDVASAATARSNLGLAIGVNVQAYSAPLSSVSAGTYACANLSDGGPFCSATATTATSKLNLFTSALNGVVASSGGGTSNYLRADGTWHTPSGSGSGTVTSVTLTGDGAMLSSTPSAAVTTSGTLNAALASAAKYTAWGNFSSITATPAYSSVPVTTSYGFAGTSSGIVTVQPQAAAGTYNFNLPTTAGNAGQVLESGGGMSSAMTWASAGSGTVTSVTFTGDGRVFSSTPSSAVTTTGTLTAALATQTANTVLGALTATTPSDLALPSCSTSASALQYTSGTGFGCNTAVAASTVTTNANLTGPITSSGNATSIASQTGTGTTFVMSAGTPVIGASTSTATSLTVNTNVNDGIVINSSNIYGAALTMNSTTGDSFNFSTTGSSDSPGWFSVYDNTQYETVFAVNGTSGNANIISGAVLGFSSSATNAIGTVDTGFSRDSAGVIDVGTGAQGSKAGSVNLTALTATGAVTMSGLTNSNSGDYVCMNASTHVLEYDATACTVSLRKYKHSIKPISGALDEVMQLQPVEFRYNPEIKHGDDLHVGFIAEDVEKIDRRIAAYKDNGELEGVDYQHVTAIDTAAIQDQQKEIEQLRLELSARNGAFPFHKCFFGLLVCNN